MQRVGIITIYKNNKNYGGLLQAYALQHAINQLGYDSEVITYLQNGLSYKIRRLQNLGVKRAMEYVGNRINTKFACINSERKEGIQVRNQRLHEFEMSIPHSEFTNDDTIQEVAANYDVLVCGSDQIWNPGLWSPVMFLDIPNCTKKRFSYAASVGRSQLTAAEKEYLRKHIGTLQSISVRENSAKELVAPLTEQNVATVLDPTLLLDRETWVAFASKPKNCPEKFVFSFFLGNNQMPKKTIKEYYKGELPIVTIPHLQTGFKKEDEQYSDIQLYDIGPREWVWLILNAECVFTDSFHGTAFSINLHRPFVCFGKGKQNDTHTINSRLLDLLDICGISERFISDSKHLEKVVGKPIDYKSVDDKMMGWKTTSLNYLKESLEK